MDQGKEHLQNKITDISFLNHIAYNKNEVQNNGVCFHFYGNINGNKNVWRQKSVQEAMTLGNLKWGNGSQRYEIKHTNSPFSSIWKFRLNFNFPLYQWIYDEEMLWAKSSLDSNFDKLNCD